MRHKKVSNLSYGGHQYLTKISMEYQTLEKETKQLIGLFNEMTKRREDPSVFLLLTFSCL